MSLVTVVDLFEVGACHDGVMSAFDDLAGRLGYDPTALPLETLESLMPNNEWLQKLGDGGGDGGGYGDGDGGGYGYGDGVGYGYGDGYGNGVGYGWSS